MQQVTIVETGTIGPRGPRGFTGVPDGGTSGQVLTKESGTDGDAGWEDATGGVESVNSQTGVVVLAAADVGADAVGAAAAAQSASQPLDSDLTAIAALSTTTFGRALLALADAAAGRTAFGLGTAATQASSAFDAAGLAAAAQAASQPVDSDLTAIAALTTTTFGRSLLTAANAAALGITASDVGAQPLDSDLTAIAALTTTTYGRGLLAAANAAALGITAADVGADASGAAAAAQAASQPVDSDLTAIAALTTTGYGRGLLTLANTAGLLAAVGAIPESQVTNLTTDLAAKAPLASPTFTGTVTLPNGTVTLGQQANLAANSIVGNNTGSGATPIALTAAQVKTLLAIGQSDVTGLTVALALLAPLASPTFTGTPTAPSWTTSGLTGAAAASRFVGATTSGAPVSGTFLKGDLIVDQTGSMWVCTTAGSPGTWTQVSGAAAGLPDSGAVVTTAGPSTVTVNKTYRIDTTSNPVARALPSAPAIGSQVLFKIVAPNPLANLFTWSTSGSDVVNLAGGATTSTLKVTGAWALFTYIGSNVWVKQEGIPIEQLDVRYAPLNAFGFSGLAWAYIARQTQTDAGYAPLTGCAVTANATPTKLDIAAGVAQIAPGREQAVAAASAWSATITSLSDATNPKWGWIEIDSAGTPQTNMGTAAATPTVPTPTINRVPVYMLYCPSTAVNTGGTVDSLAATNNGLAKLIDVRQFAVPRDGWNFDNFATWQFAQTATGSTNGRFAVSGDARPYLPVGTKISWKEVSTVKYGVVAGISFNVTVPLTSVTTDVTADTFTKTAHGLANTQPIVITGLNLTTGASLANNGIYFVVNTAANTFQLALQQGGAAIDLTGANDSAVTITGATNVSLMLNDDYLLTDTPLQPRYSSQALPAGFPTAFNYTPTIVGWSGSPPTSSVYRWTTAGRICTLFIRQSTATTSTGTTHSLTLPVTAATITNMRWDAGGYLGTDASIVAVGAFDIASAATTVGMTAFVVTFPGGTYTAANSNTGSGTSRHDGQISYEF